MTPEDLAGELAEGRVRPAYLLAGEEPLLRDDALAALQNAVCAAGAADFDADRLDGDRTTPGQLLDSVRTLPVMSPRRLVVLRDPEAQRGRGAKLTDAVAEAVEELSDDAATVLVVVAPRPDRRSRWTRAFAEPAAVVSCDSPRGAREAGAFVRAEARRQGVSIERGVAELLAERVGPQLLMLRSEIAKASLLAGPDATVTRDHVAIGSIDVAEEKVWDLTDAIGEGRSADALAALARLRRGGAPPPVMLGALATHFRKLFRAQTGAPVPGPPFVRKKLESQARRYGPGRLRSCLDAIHQTDLALKGAGGLGPELALERLVLALSG